MKNLLKFTFLLVGVLLISCEKEIETIIEENLPPEKVNIQGFVQKGPFINGTSITISELNTNLVQTGKSFDIQISDNTGSFEIKQIELLSSFVELKADGFYFNEVNGNNSSARLILYALSNILDKNSLNVNILSHLEKGRIDYLVAQGSDFSEAKKIAQKEILAIFSIEKSNIIESELLDISKAGDDNAILLAVSVILQGNLSVSELAELLANISTDIRQDGKLDDESLGTILINNAKTINLKNTRTNLENRYEELGLNITVSDFEKYVNHFIDNTNFEFTNFIEYPANGEYGINILNPEIDSFVTGNYSMTAKLPEGTSLKVKIQGNGWMFPAFQQNTGWEYSDWNDSDNSRIFTTTRTGFVDFEIRFEYDFGGNYSNKINILVYENEDIEPTWTKEISLTKMPLENAVSFPKDGKYGENLLSFESGAEILNSKAYSIATNLIEWYPVTVDIEIIKFDNQVGFSINEQKIDKWVIKGPGDKPVYRAFFGNADMEITFSGKGNIGLLYKINEGSSEVKTETITLNIK